MGTPKRGNTEPIALSTILLLQDLLVQNKGLEGPPK